MKEAAAAVLVLALGTAVAEPSAGGPSQQRGSPRAVASDPRLVPLASALAGGDVAAALQRLEPQLAADERLALDAIYVLLAHRRFSEAKDEWNRVAPRLQDALRGAPSPGAEERRQRGAAEALFVQGLLTARLGHKEEALTLLRQADGYGFPPLDSPLLLLAAECLYDLQEPELAAQAYREIVKASPGDSYARLRLAASLYAAGQLGAAESELAALLQRAPATPDAEFTLGVVLFEEKRGAEAKVHLERELARNPRCSACMAKLAHLAYLDGDDRQCESWLARAAALDPSDLETSLVYGMLYNRTGRPQLAIAPLSGVVERAPAHAMAHYQLALAYQRSGDAAKARAEREIYDRLIREQKARGLGVRGSGP